MWDFLGGVASGIGNLIGGWFGASATENAAEKQVEGQQAVNTQQINLAKENMAWQEKMSNTAHQREVDDLRAAGLNPILSAKYGGSSTPVPILPSISNPYGDYAGNKVSSAKFATEAIMFLPDVLLKAAQARNALSSSAKTQAETKVLDYGNRGLDEIDSLVAKASKTLGNWSAKAQNFIMGTNYSKDNYGPKMYDSQGRLRISQ